MTSNQGLHFRMLYRIHVITFFAAAIGLFGATVAEYIIPLEPFHKGGFGAAPYPLPNTTYNTNTTDFMKYRILHRSGDVFYIGGRGIFHRIDPHSASCPIASPNVKIGTCEEGGGGLPCSSVAPIDKDVDCHNYIRIVNEYTPLENNRQKLLVCGTNALTPRCYTFIFNETSCELQLEYPSGGIGGSGDCENEGSYDAEGLAPANWNLNYSYWYSNDNTYNDRLLFTGVSKASDETDPHWAKYNVTESHLGTNASAMPYELKLETYVIESRAVNEANFVGKPYEYTNSNGTFVLFFYRETAVEFINQGKIVYSRVGRVCRDDSGNDVKYWSSFLKARLNCSLPALYPAYFNEIQDVKIVEGGNETYFYSVLASPRDGVVMSALCRYRRTDIDNLFQTSKFKSQKTSNEFWLPVDPANEPDPRPGKNCANPCRDTAFIQNNPLLDELVNNYNPDEQEEKSDAPLFYTDSGGHFSSIAIDDQSDDIDDYIYYIGTESGNVLKAYNSNNWTVLRYWQQDDSEAITSLEFIPEVGGDGPWLFAATDNTLTQIDLKYGQAQNQEQFDQVYYPYFMGETLVKATGVIVESSPSNITTCDNRKINLFCKGNLDITSGEGKVVWYKNDKQEIPKNVATQWDLNVGPCLNPSSIFTVLALEGFTNDTYACEVSYPKADAQDTDRREFTLTVENCITTYSVEKRDKIHNEVIQTYEYRKDQYENQICVTEKPNCTDSCPYPQSANSYDESCPDS